MGVGNVLPFTGPSKSAKCPFSKQLNKNLNLSSNSKCPWWKTRVNSFNC